MWIHQNFLLDKSPFLFCRTPMYKNIASSIQIVQRCYIKTIRTDILLSKCQWSSILKLDFMEIYIPIIILYCRSAKSELLFTCHILLSPSFLLCCEWMSVYKQLLFICYLFISIPQVKVIQLTFSYYIFIFLLLPSLTKFDLYSIFTFFFKINFCIFYHILKNQHVWGHSFKKSKMASILLVVLMVCICSDR